MTGRLELLQELQGLRAACHDTLREAAAAGATPASHEALVRVDALQSRVARTIEVLATSDAPPDAEVAREAEAWAREFEDVTRALRERPPGRPDDVLLPAPGFDDAYERLSTILGPNQFPDTVPVPPPKPEELGR